MWYALNHSLEKGHLDNHGGCHLGNLQWHVTAVSAHPLGLSHQWEMSSSLLACWSLQSCLGASFVRSVFHIFFSYLREVKLSLTIHGVKVGQNTFYPAALKGSGVLSSPEWAGGRQGRQAPLTFSRPQFFTDHFQTWQGHLLPYGLGKV